MELVLAGAHVVDGTGGRAYRADVGLAAGSIGAVGDLSSTDTGRRIDVSGRVVCPGFIDMHAHSDLSLLVRPTGDSKLQQGVTTEVNGNCGFSPAPLSDVSATTVMQLHSFFGSYVPPLGWDWRSPDEYIARLESQRLSHHVVLLVGHATVRIAAMGMAHRPAAAAEMARMRDLVGSAMRAGYFGLSSGLVTAPSVYADTDELVELARVVADFGGFYATHMRGEGHSLLRATAEALEVGERSGMRLQISHHKATFRPYWGRIRQAIQLSEWANARLGDLSGGPGRERSAGTGSKSTSGLCSAAARSGMASLLSQGCLPRQHISRARHKEVPGITGKSRAAASADEPICSVMLKSRTAASQRLREGRAWQMTGVKSWC